MALLPGAEHHDHMSAITWSAPARGLVAVKHLVVDRQALGRMHHTKHELASTYDSGMQFKQAEPVLNWVACSI